MIVNSSDRVRLHAVPKTFGILSFTHTLRGVDRPTCGQRPLFIGYRFLATATTEEFLKHAGLGQVDAVGGSETLHWWTY